MAGCACAQVYVDAWRELPSSWVAGLDVGSRLAAPAKNPAVNRYGVDCGQDLRQWEESKWIEAQDPYGWFQWYCRYIPSCVSQ